MIYDYVCLIDIYVSASVEGYTIFRDSPGPLVVLEFDSGVHI